MVAKHAQHQKLPQLLEPDDVALPPADHEARGALPVHPRQGENAMSPRQFQAGLRDSRRKSFAGRSPGGTGPEGRRCADA